MLPLILRSIISGSALRNTLELVEEVPGFAQEILATSGLTFQSSGRTDWKWRGTLPSLPKIPDAACYLDQLKQVIGAGSP